MKAVRLDGPGMVKVVDVGDVSLQPGDVLLKVEMVGLCGTDLNTYRGKNAMVEFPRVIGHEIAATIACGGGDLPDGTAVTVSPYTQCGTCVACLRGRPNACVSNETMGVQRDGAMTEFVGVPREKLYPAKLS